MENAKFKMVDLRNMAGMNQKDWGKVMGVSEATIQKRETDAEESKKWRLTQVLVGIEYVNKHRGMSLEINKIEV